MLTDIRNMPKYALAVATAACVVDTAGLFYWRYYSDAKAAINMWYDQLGLVAYGADIFSIMFCLLVAQVGTTWLGGPWNPTLFCGIAVAFQLAHDAFFGAVIVPAFPKGRNTIMDLMKTYADQSGAGILVIDALIVVLTCLIAMALAPFPTVTFMTLILTLYATMYILFTKPPTIK